MNTNGFDTGKLWLLDPDHTNRPLKRFCTHLGRPADPEIQKEIDSIICEQPGIDIGDAIDNINALERKLKERIPNLKWCFVEPDKFD